jgi:hypothetical protein
MPEIPAPEFWFSGYAAISAATTLLALALGALGVGPVPTEIHHKRIVWASVTVISALTWWQLAKQEEAKAKPERDYMYVIPSGDPLDISADGQFVGMLTVATGVLKDVKIWIQHTEDHYKNRNTVYYNEARLIDEGTNLNQLPLILPAGDFTIDLDPPTKLGKVLERIQIAKDANGFSAKIEVMRKQTGEILQPLPDRLPAMHLTLAWLYLVSFISFIGALGWASWRT